MSDDVQALYSRSKLEYEVGNFRKGEEYLKTIIGNDVASVRGFDIHMMSTAAHITGVADFLELAESRGKAVVGSLSNSTVDLEKAHIGLGLVAVYRANAASAQESYSALEHTRGTFETSGAISMDRILGLLAHTMGILATAAGHFEDALAFCRKAGYRPELAWSLCDYADMLLERKGDGDQDQATSMLEESLAISTELGMRPLMERVLSRREILKA